MERRKLLIGIGATASAGAAVGTGAFSSATVDRQIAVTVADDASGLVSLTPSSGANGEYVDGSGDRVAIELGDNTAGLTEGSQYNFNDTLTIGNQGTQPLYIWTEVSSAAFDDDALYLYPGENADTPLNAANAVVVGAGGQTTAGFAVDTTGVDTDTYTPTVTLYASEDPPTEEESEEPPEDPVTEPIGTVQLDSISSLLNGNQEPLTDDSTIAVWAEPTATNGDGNDQDNAVEYPNDVDIPVIAVDDTVVGVTGPFVASDTPFNQYANEKLLLNVYDSLLGGSGTVLHDESHGQFYSLTANGDNDFRSFASYAEANGYTYEATTDIQADLATADALVVTTPEQAFTDDELDEVSSFVAGGGVVFLHDQSDFSDEDQTTNLNEVAAAVTDAFRFNDDQVFDEENNSGRNFRPTTQNFNTDAYPAYFENRGGLGVELDRTETYEVAVGEVTDGDTVNVTFPNGTIDTVRVVGIDTPETGDTDERIAEYEGITDAPALKDLGDDASDYAADQLANETVTLSFDENEPIRGNFDRLLGFLELPNGDVYNKQVIADGFARVYSSGFTQHDEYWDAEAAAQAAGDGIWEISDPAAVPESGDDPVESLFFPSPVAVSGGTSVVNAETGESLVAVDDEAGVAAIGGPLVDEGFEPAEAAADDPTNEGQQVYPFVTNLIASLTDGEIDGPVLFDGGHGQFNSDFALSAEDVAYFQRYLEGQSTANLDAITLAGTNDLTDDAGPALLDDSGTPIASALVITTPSETFTDAEQTAVADFAAAGGAVLLVGTATETGPLSNFDDLVASLETDVEFTTTAVTDQSNNLGDPSLPTTSNFTGPDELFTSFTPDDGDEIESSVAIQNIDADGDPESIIFENTSESDTDLDGYTVSDDGNYSYTFDNVTIEAGTTLTLYSGDGTDTADELYWGPTFVWNNDGDIATLTDSDGNEVDQYSYGS